MLLRVLSPLRGLGTLNKSSLKQVENGVLLRAQSYYLVYSYTMASGSVNTLHTRHASSQYYVEFKKTFCTCFAQSKTCLRSTVPRVAVVVLRHLLPGPMFRLCGRCRGWRKRGSLTGTLKPHNRLGRIADHFHAGPTRPRGPTRGPTRPEAKPGPTRDLT